jgi:hypothetical protein
VLNHQLYKKLKLIENNEFSHSIKILTLTFMCGFVVQVLDKIIKGVENFGFYNKAWIESPLKGTERNT